MMSSVDSPVQPNPTQVSNSAGPPVPSPGQVAMETTVTGPLRSDEGNGMSNNLPSSESGGPSAQGPMRVGSAVAAPSQAEVAVPQGIQPAPGLSTATIHLPTVDDQAVAHKSNVILSASTTALVAQNQDRSRDNARRRTLVLGNPVNEDDVAAHLARQNTGVEPQPAVAQPAVAHAQAPGRGLAMAFISFLAHYALDVLKTALNWLKLPIALFAILWVILFLVSVALAHASATAYQFVDNLNTIAQPLCRLPLIPAVLQFCHDTSSGHHSHANFPALMNIQGDSLELLLEESVGISGTTWELRNAEMATSDLITLVKISELNSRTALIDSLEQLLRSARAVGRSLKRLDSRINFLIDTTLAINDYAMNALLAATERHLLGDSSFESSDSHFAISRSFTAALDRFVERLSQVLVYCQNVLDELEALDRALSVIHEIVSRERVTVIGKRDELLAALWTLLGGNKKKLRSLDNHLVLLYGLAQYRTKALTHVHRTMEAVAKMEADVMQLREESMTTVMGAGVIDMQLQLTSLKAGISRLAEGRARSGAKLAEVRKAFISDTADTSDEE